MTTSQDRADQIEYINLRSEELTDAIAENNWVDAEIRARDIVRLAVILGREPQTGIGYFDAISKANIDRMLKGAS